ncbi:MAG: aminoglycoside phosphotransferase family protein [Pseudomonadota bacterium]
MHKDAYQIDDALVRDLIATQFPDWLSLPRSRVPSQGTDNVIYKLGQELCIRLPLIPSASVSLEKEINCLRALPKLPLKTPYVLGIGKPTEAYPSPWAIYDWIAGDQVTAIDFQDDAQAAADMADFISALHQSDGGATPVYGPHNHFRGCPLSERDQLTRKAIEGVSDLYPVEALLEIWRQACDAPAWSQPSLLIHGDIHAGNLVERNGKTVGVLDFGLAGRGDPAVDCIVAWSLFRGDARAAFQAGLNLDGASWSRGRGWALSTAVIALEYYRTSNPFMAALSSRTLEAVVADF